MRNYFNKNLFLTLSVVLLTGFGLFGMAQNASAAITAGNYTLKTSGGDYSSWTAFWNDLGDLTGDITLTVDASAFTEDTAPADVTENLNGYTLRVTVATFPSTIDGSTGPRFTFNASNEFLNMQMEGPGTVIIEGIVFLKGSGTADETYYLTSINTSFTFILRRCVIKGGGGYGGVYLSDSTLIYNIYNNIIFDRTGAFGAGIYAAPEFTGFVSNNTIIDNNGAGIYGEDYAGLWENNLVYNSQLMDFGGVSTVATGNNNSSYDATADDFFAGANNRINKTTSPFTNYAVDDFTLAAGSDPIGNGKDLSAYFTTDFFGNTRTTWDIGAVAYVPPQIVFTISAWLNPTTAIATKAIAVKNNEIRLVTDGSGDPVCQIHNGTAWQTGATSTAGLALNSWQYVTCTYDRSNIKIYINGVLQATQAMSNVDIQDTANDWQIGKDGSAVYGMYKGSIDDIRIYNYARTQAQIAWDYNRGAPALRWKLDENTGATAYDALKIKNGTITGADWTGSADQCKFGYCLDFVSASSDNVSIGNTARTDIRTASFWVKPDSTTQSILELSATDTVFLTDGVVTVGGFGTETIYVDGRQTTAFPDTSWHLITVVSDADITANATVLGKVSATYFDGLIDEVQLYNYVPTTAQIKQWYNEGSAVRFGPEEGLP